MPLTIDDLQTELQTLSNERDKAVQQLEQIAKAEKQAIGRYNWCAGRIQLLHDLIAVMEAAAPSAEPPPPPTDPPSTEPPRANGHDV